jgi:hypothetical protein
VAFLARFYRHRVVEREPAAIDIDRLTRDEARIIRYEKGGDAGLLIGFSESRSSPSGAFSKPMVNGCTN